MKALTYRIPNGQPVDTAENLARLQNGVTLRAAHGWAKYFPGVFRVGQHNKPFNSALSYPTNGDGEAARKALLALSGRHA